MEHELDCVCIGKQKSLAWKTLKGQTFTRMLNMFSMHSTSSFHADTGKWPNLILLDLTYAVVLLRITVNIWNFLFPDHEAVPRSLQCDWAKCTNTTHMDMSYIHKMSKHTECELCLHDISLTVPLVDSDAYLTTYRSFKEGSLKHPTIAKDSISFSIDQAGLWVDLFWKALDELEKCSLARLGCDEHMCAHARYWTFIATRMHFYARDANHRLETREKVAIANKKALLL